MNFGDAPKDAPRRAARTRNNDGDHLAKVKSGALRPSNGNRHIGGTAAGVFFWTFAAAVGLIIAAMLVNHFWK